MYTIRSASVVVFEFEDSFTESVEGEKSTDSITVSVSTVTPREERALRAADLLKVEDD